MHISDYRFFWEQPVLDLWSIPHILSGVIFFFIFRAFRVHPYLGLVANLAIAILWEVFETVTGISAKEYRTNALSDIVFAEIGYLIAILYYIHFKGQKARDRFFWASVGIFGFFSLLGMVLAQFIKG